MKLAAGKAIADSVCRPTSGPAFVVPSVFDKSVPYRVAERSQRPPADGSAGPDRAGIRERIGIRIVSVRAVTFDLWNTLLTRSPEAWRFDAGSGRRS
ncbi:MAG: hypothetical protein Ct9H300mP12_07690 [Acidimicrobiales bacterium]|nr:MAG: hypothetical protein Ct9H300mP12_07690 [Acidimicrobiales bacterium]